MSKTKKISLYLFYKQNPDTKSSDPGHFLYLTNVKSSVLSFQATHTVAVLIISQFNQKPKTTNEPAYNGHDFKPQNVLSLPPCSIPPKTRSLFLGTLGLSSLFLHTASLEEGYRKQPQALENCLSVPSQHLTSAQSTENLRQEWAFCSMS